jgi:hypothetical protein
MKKEDPDIDFTNQKEDQKELEKYSFKELLTGSILAKKPVVKQLPFIIYMAFLGIIYIANRFHAEHILRESTILQQKLTELRAESITVASELMYVSRQSQVIKLVEENNLGLKEATRPPKKVKMRD